MKNKFIVNIIHRPELSPEYAEKALGNAEKVQDESLEILNRFIDIYLEFQNTWVELYFLNKWRYILFNLKNIPSLIISFVFCSIL